MKAKIPPFLLLLLAMGPAVASGQPAVSHEPSPQRVAAMGAAEPDSDRRADKRYDEMLGKMQAAVEEIAQLYGNPGFLEVFTNDEERASRLKQALKSIHAGEGAKRDLAVLEKNRQDLLDDIALKKREADRLSLRLASQRAALDSLAGAIEQARKAVEETSQ